MAKNSIKAREKLADSLMAMQASLFVNVTSVVLIAPIGFFSVSIYKGERLDLMNFFGENSSVAMGGHFCLLSRNPFLCNAWPARCYKNL
ncbi:hypothetical protein QT882_02865 [Xanthomonas fragariae]|nr:hypothetical protein [Xanthomonas fragariae]MDM7553665.1 hypothetical protein [Xanthomonas fragariae]MDM7556815.1 hypothetical protein [Xanthomonas fragariae]MDM7574499.1 hypothetical protein [Xanthomonas fragariae]MDM7577670.1 hypothetical protein [Xanthomonas fragariae]MDM7587830.1 hypothetical protein [Xanthomonas fragariae]